MKNKTQKRIRVLTIQTDVRQGAGYLFKEVPKLRLTGLWLKKADFKPGQKVQVEIKSKKLTLKSAE